jgi:hypothetical protein
MTETAAHVVVMKAGTHAGEDLESIIARKRREIAISGWCLWGYGGSACHPVTQVQPHARTARQPVTVLFVATASAPAPNLTASREYSPDAADWKPIPVGHLVSGSKWALVLTSLTPATLTIDLGTYQAAIGPSAGKNLSAYLRGRPSAFRPWPRSTKLRELHRVSRLPEEPWRRVDRGNHFQ